MQSGIPKATGRAFDRERPMAKMIKRISIHLIKDESGAGMTEYALLIAMVGILLIGTLVALAGGIATTFNTATTALGGIGAPPPANPLAP